ncbi:hypothetical protein KC726_01095 [Candidatus Woesebacteria bacterium]|nr:hypothetical protein [Candidatus Woesebacteria bacterium]
MSASTTIQKIISKVPHISWKKDKPFFIRIFIGALLFIATVIVTTAVTYYFTIRANEEAIKAFNKGGITVEQLTQEVIPDTGYTVDLAWNDVGKKLVASGAIDLQKYQTNYTQEQYKDLLTYVTESKRKEITITPRNAYFWVNTLWALGLVQKSDVLGQGIMTKEYPDQIGNFASTAGWTLGTKDAMSLYNSTNIVDLSPEENQRVSDITGHIYRPCCGNSAAFPDCNHGMAILGLVELMVDQGFSDEAIYDAALAFNSYWFPQTYIDLAYYFETKQDTIWNKVDPKTVLGLAYSSAQGYSQIKQEIGTIPGLNSVGGSCGA